MNGQLNADNLDVELTEDGRIVIEPNYLGFLRSQGHPIESIQEVHTVKRKDSDKAHIVAKVETFDKSKSNPDLDYVADKTSLWVCDCWSFRQKSADVSHGDKPSLSKPCVHIQEVCKQERAKEDENQSELFDNPIGK